MPVLIPTRIPRYNHTRTWIWRTCWNIGRVLYRSQGLSLSIVGLFAGSFLIAAALRTGPGMGAYLPWASSLIQATPSPLPTITLSPTGFPLTHFYPGTGLFLALPTLLSGGSMTLDQSAKLAGSAAVLVTLSFFAWLLYEITRKRIGLVIFGISLLLVATNTGYYLTLLGAELFTLALVSLAIWLAWTPKKIGNLELASLSALASLLMTVRPQSILMASPAMVLGFLRWVRGRGGIPQLTWGLLYCGVPIAAGLLIVFQFNYWMTGDWTRSPYYFGNDQFKSVDFSARYLGLVLFDPKAGLLSCTPFIALGFCASLVQILDRRLDMPYRAFYVIFLVAGLAQIWMVSGFYASSGGYWVFGSRHLNLLSVYGVISVVQLLTSERIGTGFKAAVLGISLACAVYTATLLDLPHLPVAIIGGAIAVLSVALLKSLSPETASDLEYGCFGLSLLFPIFYYYAWLAKGQVVYVLTAHEIISACMAAVAMIVALYVRWNTVLTRSLAGKSVAILSLIILTVELILVARLRGNAVAFQAQQLHSPSQQFLYRNNLHMEDLEVNLQQASSYKWPEKDKQILKDFLEQEKQRTAIKR